MRAVLSNLFFEILLYRCGLHTVYTKQILFLCILIIAAVTAGCTSIPAAEDTRPVLLVTVPPVQEIVSAVAGDRFRVETIVPEGVSPHTYEPGPSDLAVFGGAVLWFSLGEGFLPLEEQISGALPDVPAAAAGSGISAVAEAGSDEGETDPHIWMSAVNGMQMTQTVRDVLSERFPEYADQFSANADAYLMRLADADAALRTAAERMNPPVFLATHGSFGYLARDYEITQLVIAEGEKEPGAKALARLADSAKAANVHIIITEPLSGTRAADVLAEEIGVVPQKIDPLSPQYLQTLGKVAEVLSS